MVVKDYNINLGGDQDGGVLAKQQSIHLKVNNIMAIGWEKR